MATGYVRIATTVKGGIIVQRGIATATLSPAAISGKTEKEILDNLAAQLSTGAIQDLFIHKNRSGTIAIATGAPPRFWPEDAHRIPEVANVTTLSD